MLFIDDDDAGAGQGRKDRRAGADDDLRLTTTDHSPGIEAFAVGEAGMEDGDGGRCPEAGAKTGGQLRSQGDLRDENQGLFPQSQGIGDGMQVDLGLAAAGDAVQQEGSKDPAVQSGVEGTPGLFLFGIEDRGAIGGRRNIEKGVTPPHLAFFVQPAMVKQAAQHLAADRQFLAQFGGRKGAFLPEEGDDGQLLRPARQIVAGHGGEDPFGARRRSHRLGAETGGKNGADRFAGGITIVIGRPQQEGDHRCREEGVVVRGIDQFLESGAVARCHVQDAPGCLPPPERDDDPAAGANPLMQAGRDQVAERVGQRRRHGNAGDEIGRFGHESFGVGANNDSPVRNDKGHGGPCPWQ